MIPGLKLTKPFLTLAAICLLALPARAQIDSLPRDIGLRQFLGVSSIGATIPISPEYKSAYFAVMVYRDGIFEKRLADQGVNYSYGGILVSVGNHKLGVAPSAVQAELLWGYRGDKMGYMMRANVGSSGVVPTFHDYPDFAKIDSTVSDLYFPGKEVLFGEFIVLGAAYEASQTASNEIGEQIKTSKLAFVLVFQQFKTDAEAVAFVAGVRDKYKEEPVKASADKKP